MKHISRGDGMLQGTNWLGTDGAANFFKELWCPVHLKTNILTNGHEPPTPKLSQPFKPK
jgi:hypothetical protein